MKKYIITIALFICTIILAKAQSNELKQILLDDGSYCYILTSQDNFIEANKQHYDLLLGNNKITDDYIKELHNYIQSSIDMTVNWPIQDSEDFFITATLNNNGKLKAIDLFTSLNLANSSELISFFNEASNWQQAFEPTFSDDSSKLYLVGWGLGSFTPGTLINKEHPPIGH
nr:hypothetical protein [uncultured Carboxylicivirga sp.]